MSKVFIIIQTLLHFLSIPFLIKLLNLDMFSSVFVIIGSFIPDIDCIMAVKKIGIKGLWYVKTKLESKPKMFILHNFISFMAVLVGSLFILSDWTFYIGVLCTSATFHLFIDFIFFLIRGGNIWQLFPMS